MWQLDKYFHRAKYQCSQQIILWHLWLFDACTLSGNSKDTFQVVWSNYHALHWEHWDYLCSVHRPWRYFHINLIWMQRSRWCKHRTVSFHVVGTQTSVHFVFLQNFAESKQSLKKKTGMWIFIKFTGWDFLLRFEVMQSYLSPSFAPSNFWLSWKLSAIRQQPDVDLKSSLIFTAIPKKTMLCRRHNVHSYLGMV